MGELFEYLDEKSSLSSIWAKVVDEDRLTKSELVNLESQSLFETISSFPLFKIFLIIGKTPLAF